MNDLAIIAERYGRIGSISRLLPEFITPVDESGGRQCCWSSAAGMLKVSTIEETNRINIDLPNEILASIVVTQQNKKCVDIMEFHGVMFFRPLGGLRWDEQIHTLRTKPSNFEVVPVFRMVADEEYAFFARRAMKTQQSERKSL